MTARIITKSDECVYCSTLYSTIPRQCCKEGWFFDRLYAISAPIYSELEGRLFNQRHVQWLMGGYQRQLQDFCDEQDIELRGDVHCSMGVLCEFYLRPRYLLPPSPSEWLPDESQRRMIWNDVTVRRLGR